jgi:HEPN domain-containing protein
MQLDNEEIAGEGTDMLYAHNPKDICHIDRMVIPWKGEPSPLVSLLDMIKFCAEDFCAFMHELEALMEEGIFDSSRPGLTSEEVKRTYELIKKASNWCKLVELDAAQELIRQIQIRILTSGWDFMGEPYSLELGEIFMALRNIIKDGLRDRLFMFVPKDQAPWYEKENGFGMKVTKAFPSAIEDIKEAGTCYATGRYNACVFHLMRVLEHGLRALATEVCLDFDQQQWHTIINQIISVINKGSEKLKQGSKKTKRLQFLSEAAIEFRYFKDAWRNHVSHNRANFDQPEALMILNHIKSFMVHLSTQLSE